MKDIVMKKLFVVLALLTVASNSFAHWGRGHTQYRGPMQGRDMVRCVNSKGHTVFGNTCPVDYTAERMGHGPVQSGRRGYRRGQRRHGFAGGVEAPVQPGLQTIGIPQQG